MGSSEDIMDILQNIGSKFLTLPKEHVLTQAAFFIIILFFLTFVTLLVSGCFYGRCGCCKLTQNRVSVI